MLTKHLRIFGKVQGVYFRDTAVEEAHKLGVTGWVRNRFDGSVEVLVQGEDAAVEAFVKWAHIGSPAARVDAVEIDEESHIGQFAEFNRVDTL